MKKVLTIFLALVVTVLFLGTASDQAAAQGKSTGTVWKIPGNFETIQEAIDSDDVEDGHTILLGNGDFFGATISKAVEIRGKGKTVITDGPLLTTYMPCGTITLNTGFFFQGGGAGTGATISNLSFEGVAFPVFSRGADDVSVSQCTMSSPIQGISNWGGNGWIIDHNEIQDLRSANGGGIGILVADSSGGIIIGNVVSHNKISGTLFVALCDGGGYQGSGIVLYADWRYGRSGSQSIMYNRVVKNSIGLSSNNPSVVDVVAFELTEALNPGNIVICSNAIGFNDFRETAIQIVISPSTLEDCNIISRNLGDNRGHGLHPSVFK